jgi:hypothetical protein
MSSITRQAGDLGRQAERSDWTDRLGRVGLVAYGVVHLMVAWLALQLALGHHGKNASQQGAVQKLAHEPYGEVLVWALAVGMFALAVWQGVEGAAGHRSHDGFSRVWRRVASLGKAVVYTAIGISAVHAATGSSSSSKKSSTDSWTARLMRLPAGQLIVGAVGVAIIGIGVYLVRKAWTEGFAKQLDAEGRSGSTGRALLVFGKAGYTAKGVAFAVVGALFVWAAASQDPRKSGGLDQALHKVLQQPFGPVLLVAIALGLACFGIFCFARSWHFSGR